MLHIQVDEQRVARCRQLAAAVADEVQTFIEAHTTVGVERTVVRGYGIEGVDDAGTPLVNQLVDRVHEAGLLGHGVAAVLAQHVQRTGLDLQSAAEELAFGSGPLTAPELPHEALADVLRQPTREALARLDAARDRREANKARLGMGPAPWKYLIVATGNIHDDALQARAATSAGADVIAVIRATAQSLLDYVPQGATTEGYGGTYATQENFRILREALDEAGEARGRYVMGCNYSSGLCMAEIAYLGALEGLDMLLNDSMYGILFRDINMRRTLVDQYFSRRILARSRVILNTGEDNYLTTADAVEAAHTVLASQFINEAFAHRAGVHDEQLGLGHAYEIDPAVEDSFGMELAQALQVRAIFAEHPIKWMPPTKHKTGDIFQGHVHDALFSLVGSLSGQSIELLGMFSEAVHNPLMMDRHLSLKATEYVFNATRNLASDLVVAPGSRMQARASQVLQEAEELLEQVERETIWKAIERGAFGDIKRAQDGGKGLQGVVQRESSYLNPLLDALEGP